MPRGGRRQGTPGKSYSNRSDLNQPVRTAPGQDYGKAGAQAAAQQAIPLPQQASPAPGASSPAPPAPGMLSAPTANPNQPVTAGLPIGPGPGPNPNMPNPSQNVLLDLQALASTTPYPTDQLRAIIERLQQDQPRGPLVP